MYENVIYGRGGIADHKRKDRYSIFGGRTIGCPYGASKIGFHTTPHSPQQRNKDLNIKVKT